MIGLFEYLIKNNITVATAESCTGGSIAAEFVEYPGISSVFLAGLCTYANSAKQNILGVESAVLEKFGAVSEECARQMLEGALRVTGAKAAVCTTGIAGPGGGTKDKPVGLVYVGAAFNGKFVIHRCNFEGNRSQVIKKAGQYGLDLLYEVVKGEK